MRRVSTVLSMIVLASLLLGVVACGTSPTAAPTAGSAPTSAPAGTSDTLVIVADLSDLVTFDPSRMMEFTSMFVSGQTYDTLLSTKADESKVVVPNVADSYQWATDGKSMTLKLHPGIKFASGNPLTAEDVRWSWMRVLNMKQATAYYLSDLERVEVVDDLTVRAVLKNTSAHWLVELTCFQIAVQDSKLVKAHGGTDAADADKVDTAKEWLDQNSAGSGPFVMTSWVPKSQIVLEANPNYWRGKPKLARVIFKHQADPTTALQMVQKGEADIWYYVDVDLADKVKADPNLDLQSGEALDYEFLGMTSNPDISKPLSDVRVRQAVMYSIDYDGILRDLVKGLSVRAWSLLPIGFVGVDPNRKGYSLDLDKARALLKEAGYEKGFEVELAYPIRPAFDALAPKIKSDLAKVGITVNLKAMEFPVWFQAFSDKKLSMVIVHTGTDKNDPANWTDWYCPQTYGNGMKLGYFNPEAQKLNVTSMAEPDPGKRVDELVQLQEIWNKDAFAVMLYQTPKLIAVRKKVQNFLWHPFYFGHLENVTVSK